MNLTSRRMNAGPLAGALIAITVSSAIVAPTPVIAQVRTKLPDRPIYNPAGPATPPPPPVHTPSESGMAGVDDESIAQSLRQLPLRDAHGEIQPVNLRPLPSMIPRGKGRVISLPASSDGPVPEPTPRRQQTAVQQTAVQQSAVQQSAVQQASYEPPPRVDGNPQPWQDPAQRRSIAQGSQATAHRNPSRSRQTLIQHDGSEEIWVEGGIIGSGTTAWAGDVRYDGTWSDGCDGGFAHCDGGCGSCDGAFGSCDGLGCDGCVSCSDLSNASLSLDPSRWFGSVELLLLFREGDSIPALVTTSPQGTEAGDAGQLPGATILAGGEQAFHDLTAGGRLTLGTWLDDCRDRSLVFRGWTAAEADLTYSARHGINAGPILAIPTTYAGAPDSVLIAFPDSDEDFGRFGGVSLNANSNVYGGDISVRQFLTGGLGTTFDVLYGYQYMHLDEDLSLSTTSTKTQDAFPDQVGNNLSTLDQFETINNFHGGQFGFAGAYREGCWSFDWLGKIGFGQIKREAQRHGRSVITTDTPPPAINDTGLLVSSANSGSYSSSTFGWVPEFDVSVGWHKYPRFDVTFGYNIIAMSDAVRLSGIMDPTNTLDTPRSSVSSGTFMMHGMHFGIRHVW